MSEFPEFDWDDEPITNDSGNDYPVENGETLTYEDVLAEWEKADEVMAAKLQIAAEKKAQEEKQAALAEAQAKQLEIHAQMAELRKQMEALTRKASSAENEVWRLRNSIPGHDRQIQKAEAVIRVAKENYEKQQTMEQELARMEIDVTQFAYGKGLSDGRKIMDHQIEAAKIIAMNKRVILGDDMGVGKTLSMIASMDFAQAKRILIVCPADVTSNFEREVRLWAPHRMVVNIKGMTKATRNATLDMAQMLDDVVVLVNYEAWRRDTNLLTKFEQLQFDMLLMDEAHVMKSVKTNAQEGMDRIVNAMNTCMECGGYVNGSMGRCVNGCLANVKNSIEYVVPATGTPILNSPADLFPLLRFVDPKNFYNVYDFLSMYAEMDVYTSKYKFASGGESMLMKRMGHRFIRRTMQDVGIELPRQQIIHHDLEWGEEDYKLQYEVYCELRDYSEVILGGTDEYGNPRKISTAAMIALITRQRQATVWPAGIKINVTDEMGEPTGEVLSVGERVQESIKIDKAVELIEEAWLAGKRVAVFSQFKTGLAELQRRLENTPIRSVRFDGDTPAHIRDEIKINFNRAEKQEAKWDAVLCNYKTGGVGLNLTECTHMILLDMEWNPGKEEQALRRIARIGQTEETFVHVLNVADSIDGWMRDLIETKRDIINGFESEQKDFQSAYLEGIKKGKI